MEHDDREADKEYAGEYTHDGHRWAMNVFAKDEADARAKFESVRETIVFLGGPVTVIPWDPLAKFTLNGRDEPRTD